MYNKLNDFHNKFTRFKTVAPWTKDRRILKNKVLSNTRSLYNDLYYIHKDKYNKEINSLNTENRIKLDYKNIKTCWWLWVSVWRRTRRKKKEEQEEEREEKQKEEQEQKQKEEQEEEQEEIFPINSDDKTEQQTSKKQKDDAISSNKWIIDEEENINKELLKNYFLFQTLSALLKYLYQTNDKEKNNKLVNVINSVLKT